MGNIDVCFLPQGPGNWEDVLQPRKLHGQCHNEACGRNDAVSCDQRERERERLAFPIPSCVFSVISVFVPNCPKFVDAFVGQFLFLPNSSDS